METRCWSPPHPPRASAAQAEASITAPRVAPGKAGAALGAATGEAPRVRILRWALTMPGLQCARAVGAAPDASAQAPAAPTISAGGVTPLSDSADCLRQFIKF